MRATRSERETSKGIINTSTCPVVDGEDEVDQDAVEDAILRRPNRVIIITQIAVPLRLVAEERITTTVDEVEKIMLLGDGRTM